MGNDSIMNPAISRGRDPNVASDTGQPIMPESSDRRRGLRDPNDDLGQ